MSNNSVFFPREILKPLKKYLPRREILAIKGPRQSGKTTLLKYLEKYLLKEGFSKDQVIYATFEDKEVLEKFIIDSKAFIKSFLFQPQEKYFFLLDEYQYVPEAGQKLKLLFDLFPQIKLIISGSSSLELTGQTAKFLVGRLFSFYLYPLNFREYISAKDKRLAAILKEKQEERRKFLFQGKKFNVEASDPFLKDFQKHFEEYAVFGGYPEVVKTADKEIKKEILKNIVNTYLEKDIVGLLKIGDFLKFKNLAVILASQVGNLLNYNQLSNDTGLYFNQLKKYLAILEETYILKLLRPYFRNLTTELKKNPKEYFLDPGLRNYLVGNFSHLNIRADKGHLAEMMALTNCLFSFGEDYQYRFWRTTGGAEVDLILKRGEKVFPIEVKYSSFKKPRISRSLRSFLATYCPSTTLVLTADFSGSLAFKKTKIYFSPIFYF